MYCKKCGMQVEEGSRFCPTCGNDLTKDIYQEKEDDFFKEYDKKEEVESNNTNVQEPMSYKVFAIIGFVSGIVSICLCWIPWMFNVSIPGMIFSKVGYKSKTKSSNAKTGFALSLVATIINIIITIALLVFIIIYAKDHPDADLIFGFDFD
ncbi:MAG: zinc-ribbon domain-containing protein [Acholeplasmatales bacterium]|nr:zinc-ribbon domain-containing protein [Acholeplasmatales bacterium]